ncbi:MAG: hypothetical protein PHU25_06570 [Deltaproteobacteria bacterium]|nr:hypothetical protein [Deltaproteobacteria bacterium]
MKHMHILLLVAAVALAIPIAGCDKGGGGDDDTVTDAGKDAAPDANEDTGSESDTGKDYSCVEKPWDGVHKYGEDYVDGPYGFKGSICRDPVATTQEWIEYGDTIPDICLPNQDNEEVCVHDFYKSPDFDLLVVNFSALW